VNPDDLVAACVRRTDAIVAALDRDDVLSGPSILPGWDRLTVACHLRYGAEALGRITDAALAGEPVAYYPSGRSSQRPGTLHPRAGESPLEVVASLAEASAALHDRWADVADWDVVAHEPDDNPDLGDQPLATFLLLRLTEVEVHGTDLDVGLPDWSPEFVIAAMPMRVARSDTRIDGRWTLVATDGESWEVGTGPNRGRIEASRRDLMALLLGRSFPGY
jgi:maleylpyruvate isomerase